ncbi:PRC-barrel domain-containing protein [Jiella sonneratiae]|uniref:PRC-barrel domain-containing protein n=1 Tax=Jiella sonneratiae TaxID=2816856 RepID=A0ABS3IZH5_9HYPH|nr:PRC-barrel domain-containing protein [Jiella sonneratiae]MBO0902822.1 PRC-barrel domain-containing protein [Jiella sonneratiae]
MKPFLSAGLAALLLAGAAGQALAQDGGTTQPDDAAKAGQAAPAGNQIPSDAAAGVLAALGEDEAPVPQLNLMVGQVEEMDVVGPNGETVGEVDDVLGDANGNAKAITVEVGGFLGIGQKTVILMLSDVSLDMGRVKTPLTKDQIEKLPAFGG